MKTNKEIDKYLEKNLGTEKIENNSNLTYFEEYTGKIKYEVNCKNIINQYSILSENECGIFGIDTKEEKKIELTFECEKATFGITEDGFIDWEQGNFLNGDFVGDFNGVWKNGKFHYGNFLSGVWWDGEWNGCLFEKAIWKNGTWLTKERIFGDKYKSIFTNSIWENGIWNNGNFVNSTWLNGRWKTGYFVDSQWINGVWENGNFIKSIWVDGNWCGGEFNDGSAWLSGPFSYRDEISENDEGKFSLKNIPKKFNYKFGEK